MRAGRSGFQRGWTWREIVDDVIQSVGKQILKMKVQKEETRVGERTSEEGREEQRRGGDVRILWPRGRLGSFLRLADIEGSNNSTSQFSSQGRLT